MKHILFLDPIEHLAVAKDSTLLLAHTLREEGHEVYLLFAQNLYVLSDTAPRLEVFEFTSQLKDKSFYLDSFVVTGQRPLVPGEDVLLYIRPDPPFDQRYLNHLWMLNSLKRFGVKLLNDPAGILLYNEKMAVFHADCHLVSYVGSSVQGLWEFAQRLESQGYGDVVMKPLNLYQGIGVEKVSLADKNFLQASFERKVREYGGGILVQPFIKKIASGEIRTIFFGQHLLGAILKVPPPGEFLANIARGASYSAVELDQATLGACRYLHRRLGPHGLHWFAYDVLDGHVNEINITCPGLLVEVSAALGRNLAIELIHAINDGFCPEVVRA